MKKLVLVVMLAGFGSLAATAQEKPAKAKEKPATETKAQESPGKPANKGEVSPKASPNATKATQEAPGRSKKSAPAPAKISVNEEGLPAEKDKPATNND